MDRVLVNKHKLLNFVQSVALVLLLACLLGYIALLIGGVIIAWVAFSAVIILYVTNPVIAPKFILRVYHARRINVREAQELYQLVEAISERAEMQRPPELFYIPSQEVNAFALGTASNSVVAISEGILGKLNFEELAAILAHEIAHIQNNDIRIMTFADISGRITKILSLLGQLLVLINLPLILLTDMRFNWFPLLVLIFAPWISDLIQLGLSRVREYKADLGSALLLGDARPLASALAKMEYYKYNLFRSLFYKTQKMPEPSLLRTHPPTKKRIKRLMEFQHEMRLQPMLHRYINLGQDEVPIRILRADQRRPRRYLDGFWH